MKPLDYFLSSLLLVSFINSAYTQTDSLPTVTQVIQHMTDVLNSHETFHYKVQMRFKAFGEDSFGIRNFTISYKSPTDNPLYGYDWEIAEQLDSGYTYTIMATPGGIYGIFSGNKNIGQGDLPKIIEPGSFTEFLRRSFIFSKVLEPFTSVSPHQITVMEYGNDYYLTRQLNAGIIYQLVVSKETWLPIQSICSQRDTGYNFMQIEEVNFITDEHIWTLPDTAFSPDHYLSLGYKLHHNENDESEEQHEKNTISPESRQLLLNYPFVTATGDTTSINSLNTGYIVLDFWYASCEPCLRALPVANQLANDYAEKGLQVIGINCFNKDGRENVVRKLRDKNITISLFFGSRDLTDALHINGFPSYVLITPDRHVDFIDGGIDDVKQVLEDMYHK